MTRSVWKYEVPIGSGDWFNLEIPMRASPLCVQMQTISLGGLRAVPQLWMLVDPAAPRVTRRFRIAGTGYSLPDGLAYIGTFQMADGQLVGHLFEDPRHTPEAAA